MGDLQRWAFDNSPILRFESGKPVVGIYKGFKIVADSFNPGKEKIQYTLEVNGKEKFWSTGSSRIAEFFDSVEVGTFIKITANGEGMKRRYSVAWSEVEEGPFIEVN